MENQDYSNEQIDIFIENVKGMDISEEKKTRHIEIYESMRPENKVDVSADIKQWSQDLDAGIQRHVKGPITENSSKADIEAWAKSK